jgi:hypothetical protein
VQAARRRVDRARLGGELFAEDVGDAPRGIAGG